MSRRLPSSRAPAQRGAYPSGSRKGIRATRTQEASYLYAQLRFEPAVAMVLSGGGPWIEILGRQEAAANV